MHSQKGALKKDEEEERKWGEMLKRKKTGWDRGSRDRERIECARVQMNLAVKGVMGLINFIFYKKILSLQTYRKKIIKGLLFITITD